MCEVNVEGRFDLYSDMTRQWEWAGPCKRRYPSWRSLFAEMNVTVLFSRERLSFVLQGIPNGDTHHLEVCAEEEILHTDEIAGRIGTLEG
jgi:hypothetical protein